MTKIVFEKELKEEGLKSEIQTEIWCEFYDFFDRIHKMEPFDLDIIEKFKDEFVVSLDELFRLIKS